MVEKVEVKLVYPNEATDQWNNKGTWTMIYNQVNSYLSEEFFSSGLRGHCGWTDILCLL